MSSLDLSHDRGLFLDHGQWLRAGRYSSEWARRASTVSQRLTFRQARSLYRDNARLPRTGGSLKDRVISEALGADTFELV
ncbi:hypothetical protein K523DRAFT_358844 [Schizophyllum commune Tattone D]|nr:hypothetical protein K523DRAFT_358844 [Schizophyllum commune Tattone D]